MSTEHLTYEPLSDIVEVRPTNAKTANMLLARGYRLLAVTQETFWKQHNAESIAGFVFKTTSYIVGRPASVERVDLKGENAT